ncbi:ferric reduction oxidase 2 [Selaginella moellendorffii]|uniref:ferric reduction oxidase 2 n=1 Tax=Selaginella moellendorffii TaxID=88036 RepID=UPI000D1C351B|nr:ferric reduction oxidase 2 [Selaginella moellendorffii]|eukprot:XP_024516116.1 ferric reduction oxidase 2 [Selaginella moellendorffii]
MAIVFAGWMMVWIMRPTRTWTNNFWNPVLRHVSTKAYGDTGAYTLIYISPILLVAFVGAIYLSYSKKSKTMKPLKINPWNYPVFVRGPLALISLSELALLGAFVALFAWTTAKHLKNSFDRINIPFMMHPGMSPHMDPLWQRKFNIVGGRLGAAGAVPFAFLFFPVARFSSLFQLIKIPFEHSIRYHIWIGHIMMVIWSAHSIVYVMYWPIAHKSKEFILWEKTSIAGFTGMFAWIVGLLIWVTSLNPVRKQRFELFYYTHQLYILFVIGFVFHVGEKWLAMMVAGIFLFTIDRLFRFLQSRRHVEVVSARMISSETIELTFAKLPNMNYPAASVIFVNLPAISGLQWHPFTVTSCSGVELDKLSILVKCSGKWTYKLRELIVQEGYKGISNENPSPTRDISKIKKQVRGISRTQGYKLYAATILASFLGYMLLAGVIHRYYIFPQDHNTYKAFSRAGRGFISLMEYIAGVVFFGGATILAWNCWKGKDLHLVDAPYVGSISAEVGLKPTSIQVGKRPEFQDIIPEHSKGRKEYVGVFACGPEGMQESVGVLCQAHKLNFHPLNFEL